MEQLLRARLAALDTPSDDRRMHAQSWPVLALEAAWWSRLRDRAPVRTALAFVLHDVWERRMQQAFAHNERLGRGVRNVTQLAELLVRDASGLNRRVNSETGDGHVHGPVPLRLGSARAGARPAAVASRLDRGGRLQAASGSLR